MHLYTILQLWTVIPCIVGCGVGLEEWCRKGVGKFICSRSLVILRTCINFYLVDTRLEVRAGEGATISTVRPGKSPPFVLTIHHGINGNVLATDIGNRRQGQINFTVFG